jgi:centromere-localized protein 2
MTSESTLLKNFLIIPSSLPTFITLDQFTALFPPKHQKDASIPSLYYEIHHQRAQDIDAVKHNIKAELVVGEKQKRLIRRGRRQWHQSDLEGFDENNVRMEEDVKPLSLVISKPLDEEANAQQLAHLKANLSKPHTIDSIIPDMDNARLDLTQEIMAMEEESKTLLADIKATIGDLSDLRTGRFSKTPGSGTELGQDVLEGLKRLEQICDDVRQS